MLIDHVVQLGSASSSFAFSTQQSTQQSIAGWCPTPLGYLGGCLGHSGNLGLVVGGFFYVIPLRLVKLHKAFFLKSYPKKTYFTRFLNSQMPSG